MFKRMACKILTYFEDMVLKIDFKNVLFVFTELETHTRCIFRLYDVTL
jgi:hypothetical protein